MRASAFASVVVAGGCLALSSAAPLAQVERGNDIASYATWETVFAHRDLQGVLGASVRSAAGEDMGHIVQVLVDQAGFARAAVIDFGGFLGVGSRKIAVEWNALRFPADAKISLELTRDQVKAAPEYQDGKPVVVLGALGKLEPLPFR